MVPDVTAEPNARVQLSFGDLHLLTPLGQIQWRTSRKCIFDGNLIFVSEIIEDWQSKDLIGRSALIG